MITIHSLSVALVLMMVMGDLEAILVTFGEETWSLALIDNHT